tara:strand:- start:8463 stop:9749 length:1287 start_codon:yes stop_codon:yes gene_type:complete
MNKPDNLCMAPWTHTYLSPQTERRLCCASREPAQSFTQYIDTDAGDNVYTPQSLDEYWNSERIRRVRRDMMNNIVPAECEVCDKKLLNTDVYRDYFGHLFAHKYPEVVASTDETGYTTMKPVSWDYRFSNLCNFKCRMCGPMLSSSWETEARKAGKIEPWMEPAVKKQISNYQDTQIEAEFSQAVEEHRIEEIYWVGGEPLMYEQHWRYMQRIIELGDGPGLYARYNTNLSRVDYQGVNLYNDILDKIRDWQICASLDGVGEVGEYIRTGLKYDEWLENFKQGLGHARNRRMMRIDFTLTTPGLFEVPEIIKLADELGVEVLAKTTFAFTPDIAMSPLFLPRPILEQIINSIMPATPGAMRDVLTNLINRPTFEEEYPSEVYLEARCRAKQRIESLDTGRKGTRFVDTLRDPELIKWWKEIPSIGTTN